jgi:hypothetical protein
MDALASAKVAGLVKPSRAPGRGPGDPHGYEAHHALITVSEES